jgi:uncharacterized protein YbcI
MPVPAPGEVSVEISRRMVKLLREKVGRGPSKVRTTANTNTILVAYEDILTQSERSFVDAGQAEQVQAARQHVGEILRTPAIEIVEHLARRPVRAYVSGVDTQANVGALVFFLDEIPEDARVGVSEASTDGETTPLSSNP